MSHNTSLAHSSSFPSSTSSSSVSFRRMKTRFNTKRQTATQSSPEHTNLKQHSIWATHFIPSPAKRVKCQIGLYRSHHLGKVVACIYSPPSYPFAQVPITSSLKLEVTGHSGRGVFAPPISSHAAPLRAVSLITYQQDEGT